MMMNGTNRVDALKTAAKTLVSRSHKERTHAGRTRTVNEQEDSHG